MIAKVRSWSARDVCAALPGSAGIRPPESGFLLFSNRCILQTRESVRGRSSGTSIRFSSRDLVENERVSLNRGFGWPIPRAPGPLTRLSWPCLTSRRRPASASLGDRPSFWPTIPEGEPECRADRTACRALGQNRPSSLASVSRGVVQALELLASEGDWWHLASVTALSVQRERSVPKCGGG